MASRRQTYSFSPSSERARRVLVLDAVRGGGEPGTLYQLVPEEIELRPEAGGAHVVSVLEARYLLPPAAAWPEITVLGVEPLNLEYGLTLSPPVARTLPRLVAAARRILCEWAEQPSPSNPLQVVS